MQPPARHDRQPGGFQRPQRQALDVGPAGRADIGRGRQGLADQPAEQGGVGRQLGQMPAQHPGQGVQGRAHLAAAPGIGLDPIQGRDDAGEARGLRDRGRGS